MPAEVAREGPWAGSGRQEYVGWMAKRAEEPSKLRPAVVAEAHISGGLSRRREFATGEQQLAK